MGVAAYYFKRKKEKIASIRNDSTFVKKKKTELAFRKKEKVDSGTCTKREVVMHSLHFGEKSFIPLPQN
jgi:hypothetical protein